MPSFIFPDANGNLFPLNHVFWSLFFELWVANVLFGAFWRQLRGAALWSLLVLCAGVLIAAEAHFHTIDVGMMKSNVLQGLARVCFSFFAGVALCRLHLKTPSTLQGPSLAVVAATVLALVIRFRGRSLTCTSCSLSLCCSRY